MCFMLQQKASAVYSWEKLLCAFTYSVLSGKMPETSGFSSTDTFLCVFELSSDPIKLDAGSMSLMFSPHVCLIVLFFFDTRIMVAFIFCEK